MKKLIVIPLIAIISLLALPSNVLAKGGGHRGGHRWRHHRHYHHRHHHHWHHHAFYSSKRGEYWGWAQPGTTPPTPTKN